MEERMSEKKNMTGKENSFHMENFRRRSRYAAVFLVLILAFAAITVLNINSGNVNISIPEIFRILLRRTGEGKAYNIIWKIRLPRILMAAILGGALSLSGFLLQTFFENPIAGPFVLGISSGAKIDRKSTRLNSSHRCITYAVFCLKKIIYFILKNLF